jgi:hypothetical protein
MSSERKVDPFAIIIIIISLIGIILIAASYFAGFYLSGYGYRYSCLSGCGYTTGGDLAAQVFMILLLLAQIILAINELLPNKFFSFEKMDIIRLILSSSTILFALIGIGVFGITYGFIGGFDWWPEAGFYGGFAAGIINSIFYILRFKNVI